MFTLIMQTVAIKREQNKFICYAEREQLERS